MPDGCLDTAEAEIVAAFFDLRARKANRPAVSVPRQLINRTAPRIPEAEHLCHFVVRLTRCVVARAAQVHVIADTSYAIKKRVPAGSKQSDIREICSLLQMNREQMSFEVIDADERNLPAKCDSFRKRQTDQQGTDETGPVSHRDSTQILHRGLRPLQSRVDDWHDILDMLARSDLRYDTAIRIMNSILRRDDVGEDFRTVA